MLINIASTLIDFSL